MFIPKGSNKHKERPRLKSFSGEVLLCTLQLGVVGVDWLLAVADQPARRCDKHCNKGLPEKQQSLLNIR